MIRVMMEEEKFLRSGLRRDLHHIIQAAMPPAFVACVFLAIVLRIEDQHIHVAQEFDELPRFVLRKTPPGVVVGFCRVPLMLAPVWWLVVRKERDRTSVHCESVADANARMICEESLHPHRAELEIEVAKLVNLDIARQLLEPDGEVRTLH